MLLGVPVVAYGMALVAAENVGVQILTVLTPECGAEKVAKFTNAAPRRLTSGAD